ncbi:MAG TPA: bifunctional (p)ppGpp synthetase/guanosine-3',5'-bis(diphosphate) 3'-pyrophosphohydrolase [Leucothrix sp.]|nr:bifunctional (p)ppGpp synthetase/guanosine-3',5'-bis(diphosphate) 3'-pyrophosphohydrolase [Leucothrix sp.]
MPEKGSSPLISATDLVEMVGRYMNDEDAKRVYDAFLVAGDAHDGVVRKSGEFYIFHPIAVAYTLANLHMDVDTICAALLHDVIEDTDVSKEDIVEQFGATVAHLVDGVTKLAGGEFTSRQEAAAASFQKMMAAVTQDFRVVLIKLADRLHNVKTLGVRKPDAKKRIALETLDIHVPLARRLGMNTLRKDLQVTAFMHLYPWRARILRHAINDLQIANTQKHLEILSEIRHSLFDNGISPNVLRWDKNIYKLYTRMKNSIGKKRLCNGSEALELRILVDSPMQCYTALGVIHQLYQPKFASFKDFIATPKIYGFQALQTALLTPQGQIILVQIQTQEMYHVAQYGITAHYRNPNLSKSGIKPQEYLNNWLKQVEEIQEVTGNAAEFLEDMKADLFLSEIYVYTPQGQTKVLPKGATVVDFAYSIHTEIGNKCVSAIIDGAHVRLNTPLGSGAMIEIITDDNATPDPAWENFVITAKARSSIRSWNNKRKNHEFIHLGKKLIKKALSKYGASLKSIDPNIVEQVLEVLELENKKALFTNIAKGNQSAKLVARRLLGDRKLAPISEDDKNTQLLIKGTEGLAVHLETCCYPISGDAIAAQLDERRGLEVHRTNCPKLPQNDKETITIAWNKKPLNDHHFLAALEVRVRNRVGVLSHITHLLEKMRVNIEDINISGDDNVKDLYFLIQVENTTHLRKIAESFDKISHVINVARPFKQE